MDHLSTEMLFNSEAYSEEFLIDLYKKLLKPRLVEEKMIILLHLVFFRRKLTISLPKEPVPPVINIDLLSKFILTFSSYINYYL